MYKKPINLFWTGGWDSTFRLIQLVLVYKKAVQPFYIIDDERNSILFEVRAMTKIKNKISEIDSKASQLILPTRFKEKLEIKPNLTITESFNTLFQAEPIAPQYEWLARFCAEEGISDMEICNERAIHDEDNRTRRLLDNDLQKHESTAGYYYQLNPNVAGADSHNVYGNFRFPVFDFTKVQMLGIVKTQGYDFIINESWFCLMPTKSGHPCGKCHPCRAVFREGLKYRLPFAARVRYHTWPTFRKVAKKLNIYNEIKN